MDGGISVSSVDRVREILSLVLDVHVDQISQTASIDDHDRWDSLAQMNLVIALEEEFGVVIPDAEVGTLVTVPLIVALLSELTT